MAGTDAGPLSPWGGSRVHIGHGVVHQSGRTFFHMFSVSVGGMTDEV